MKSISIAHSPDSDDHLFFAALREGQIRDDPFVFQFATFPTDELNQRALAGLDDVVAISAAVLPRITDRYIVLSAGASVGRNYGPVLVARGKSDIKKLCGGRIGVPGKTTTACAIVQLMLGEMTPVEIPIVPYEGIFRQLEAGQIDGAVLIHEGQLDYKRFGCVAVASIGEWWAAETGSLPLPLGVNVIRRDLGESASTIATLIERSIDYGLSHVEEMLPKLSELNRTRETGFTEHSRIREYLSLYANEDSRAMKADVRQALKVLVERISGKPTEIEIL